MLRKLGQAVCGISAAVIGLALAIGGLQAANTADVPTILDIMEEGHSGKKSLINKVKTAVKEDKLADALAPAKKLKEFGEALGKNTPEKGSKASWAKLSAVYKSDTAAIAEAVSKKDKKATEDALSKITKSCQACHDVHQP